MSRIKALVAFVAVIWILNDEAISSASDDKKSEFKWNKVDRSKLKNKEPKIVKKGPPEMDNKEIQKRLKILIEDMDANSDGFVTVKELLDWINNTHRWAVPAHIERQRHKYFKDGKTEISWEEYNGKPKPKESAGKENVDEDYRTWKWADLDDNDLLSLNEFKHYLHPFEYDRMKKLFGRLHFDRLDENKDGRLDRKEYDKKGIMVDKEDIEEEFKRGDVNGDSHLTIEEVIPLWYGKGNRHQSLATIFKKMTDINKDGKMSKKEILEQPQLFVNIPNFGDGPWHNGFGMERKVKHDEL